MSTIGLDYDGVINQMTESSPGEFLPPIEGALMAVTSFLRDGFEVVVYTARTDLGEVKQWLVEHGFPKLVVTNEKLPADIYVDDKGYRFSGRWDKQKINEVKELAGGKSVTAGGKIID